jgi:hypothetical protein
MAIAIPPLRLAGGAHEPPQAVGGSGGVQGREARSDQVAKGVEIADEGGTRAPGDLATAGLEGVQAFVDLGRQGSRPLLGRQLHPKATLEVDPRVGHVHEDFGQALGSEAHEVLDRHLLLAAWRCTLHGR